MMNIQPDSVEIRIFDGIFVKSIVIKHKNVLVPQHSHTYDHASFLATGSIRVWKDGVLLGDFVAPTSLIIPARTKHKFLSLEDNTTIYCIHNIKDAEDVDVAEEHVLNELGGIL